MVFKVIQHVFLLFFFGGGHFTCNDFEATYLLFFLACLYSLKSETRHILSIQ